MLRLEKLARLRQTVYRVLASTFLYPEPARVEALSAMASELLREGGQAARFSFFPRWRRLLASLSALHAQEPPEEEYIRAFLHSPDGPPCHPYESVYLDPGRQAGGWIAARLESEYAAAGLSLARPATETPDHVSVELEFLSFLCGQEAAAWEEKDAAEGTRIMTREAAFLEHHLLLWLPAWTGEVTRVDDRGIYGLAAGAAHAFVVHDRDLIRLCLYRHSTAKAGALYDPALA